MVGVGLVWLVVFRGYSDYLARIAPSRALALNPGNSEALFQAADRALLDGRLDDAREHARRAVAAMPLEGRALRVLGARADLDGDDALALDLMQAAARLSPRDTPTQFWLAFQALREQRLELALERIDRLLRIEPDALRDVTPLLSLLAANRASLDTFVGHLARRPPWRSQFLVAWLRQGGDAGEQERLFAALERAGAGLHPDEREAWLAGLVQRREWERLRRQLGPLEPLRDGSFEAELDHPVLGWQIASGVSGVDIDRVAVAGAAGRRALRLGFHGLRVEFRHVEQLLLLEPGRYRFTGRKRLDAVDTAQGLLWRVECMDARQPRRLGESELARGNTDWSSFEFAFEVPAEACSAQSLRLELHARIAAEREIRGIAWFDDLVIAPTVP